MSDGLDLGHERLCHICGYNLRGLVEPRCPECGMAFDPNQLPPANVAWVHRKIGGVWRAYWKTVAKAMFHPTRLTRDIGNSDIDLTAAERFRWVLLWQAVVSVALGVGACLFRMLPPYTLGALILVLSSAAWGFLFFATISLNAGTHYASVFRQVNWLCTVYYYACAPLAVTPGIVAMIVIGFHTSLPMIPFILLAVVLMMLWWIIGRVAMMNAIDPRGTNVLRSVWELLVLWIVGVIFAVCCSIVLAAFLGVLGFWTKG